VLGSAESSEGMLEELADGAHDASLRLEEICIREKESEIEPGLDGDRQLLAAATIDLLLAGELAIAGGDAPEAPSPDERLDHWQTTLREVDAAFGLGEGEDPGGTVLAPNPPPDSEPPNVPFWRRWSGGGALPPIEGGAPGAPVEELRKCCLRTADQLLDTSAGPAARAVNAMLIPGGDLVIDLVTMPVPMELPDFEVFEQVRRLAGRMARLVLRAINKLIATVGEAVRGQIGNLGGILVTEVANAGVALVEDPLAIRALKRASAHGTFDTHVSALLHDKQLSAEAALAGCSAAYELRDAFDARAKWVNGGLYFASAIAHALLAVGGPALAVAGLAAPVGYLVVLLRMRFETLPSPLPATSGIPSIVEECLA
jgi:hypothetical protein